MRVVSAKNILPVIHWRLYKEFGPQHWWPAESPFEVIVGTILTQNTNWLNVEKAIGNLRAANCLCANKIKNISSVKLAKLIRPSGYYNIKVKRLKSFIRFLFEKYGGSLPQMFKASLSKLRCELLAVKGIGPETADSILLYAGGKPIFVVDTYTKRILARHNILGSKDDYKTVQDIFMRNLKPQVRLFNEFHALLVRVGKDFCKKKPLCNLCPLKGI
ncbi:MAG: endonuclease III domain-containing protein [Candidatus Omnitrophota bacterium]|nr:endonuclease III domain-containing protein [Candidatus Omnitrophota bacterium]